MIPRNWIDILLGAWIYIQAVLSTNIEDHTIEFKVWPKEQKVAEHGIATFMCDTTAIPVPPMYWRRNGRRLTNKDNYQIFRTWLGTSLRIEPVRAKRDDARFECVLEDGTSEHIAQAAVLRVYPKGHKPRGYPRILEDPTLRVVDEEETCLLACTVEGEPKPKVTWYKDYVPLDMEVYRYNLLPEGSLQIGYAADTDQGTYECMAENELGVAYSNPARLIVEEYSMP